jgi:hypothetical protein
VTYAIGDTEITFHVSAAPAGTVQVHVEVRSITASGRVTAEELTLLARAALKAAAAARRDLARTRRRAGGRS